jgi:hypothetical protein
MSELSAGFVFCWSRVCVASGTFPADACGNVEGTWQRVLAEIVSTMRLGEIWNFPCWYCENSLCATVAHVRVAGGGGDGWCLIVVCASAQVIRVIAVFRNTLFLPVILRKLWRGSIYLFVGNIVNCCLHCVTVSFDKIYNFAIWGYLIFIMVCYEFLFIYYLSTAYGFWSVFFMFSLVNTSYTKSWTWWIQVMLYKYLFYLF